MAIWIWISFFEGNAIFIRYNTVYNHCAYFCDYIYYFAFEQRLISVNITALSQKMFVKSFRRFKKVGFKGMGLVFLWPMGFWVIAIRFGLLHFICTLKSFKI